MPNMLSGACHVPKWASKSTPLKQRLFGPLLSTQYINVSRYSLHLLSSPFLHLTLNNQQWLSSTHLTASNSASTKKSQNVVCSSKTCSKVSIAQQLLWHLRTSRRVSLFFFRGYLLLFFSLDIGESDQPIPLPNVNANVMKKVGSSELWYYCAACPLNACIL